MLQFRTAAGRRASRPPNYLGHSFQRPFLFVFLIGAAIVWLMRGGDPLKWVRFFNPKPSPPAVAEAPAAAHQPRELPTGAVLMAAGQPVEGKKLFGGIDPQVFARVVDQGQAQVDPNFFTAMKALVDADERDIEAASVGEVVYSQLNTDPAAYRGEIVTVAGIVREVKKPVAVYSKETGIRKYYEVYIAPDNAPGMIVAACYDLPADFPYPDPAKKYLGQKVKISGYFYQKYRPAEFEEKDPSLALVIAKTLRWTNPAAAEVAAADQAANQEERFPGGIPKEYALPALGIGMALLLFLAVWSYRMSKTSVLNRGPIVGRARRAAEAAKQPDNLNSLKIEP